MACPNGNTKTETKPKKKRRFETVVEEETVAIRDERRDSFSATAKKKKGRPKKADVQVELVEESVTTIAPERRPRRRAAASALARVTEGFAEEDAPIDKKRRDPEPEKPARRDRKKAVPAVLVEDVELEKESASQEHGVPDPVSQKQEIQVVGTVAKKTAARPAKRKRKVLESPSERVPLGETDVNVPSPKKQDKTAKANTAEICSPTSPVAKIAAKVAAKTATKRRKAVELPKESDAVDTSQSKSTAPKARKPVRRDVATSDRSRKGITEKAEKKLPPTTPAEPSEESTSKVSPNIKVSRESESAEKSAQPSEESTSKVSSKIKVTRESKCADKPVQPKRSQKPVPKPPPVPKPCNLDHTAKKDSHPLQHEVPDLLSTKPAKPKPRAKKAAEPAATSQQDEDVDWLFETIKKPNLRSRQLQRKPPVKSTQRAKLPDFDLDDEMLSNIASWGRR